MADAKARKLAGRDSVVFRRGRRISSAPTGDKADQRDVTARASFGSRPAIARRCCNRKETAWPSSRPCRPRLPATAGGDGTCRSLTKSLGRRNARKPTPRRSSILSRQHSRQQGHVGRQSRRQLAATGVGRRSRKTRRRRARPRRSRGGDAILPRQLRPQQAFVGRRSWRRRVATGFGGRSRKTRRRPSRPRRSGGGAAIRPRQLRNLQGLVGGRSGRRRPATGLVGHPRKLGQVQLARGDHPAALQSFRDGVALAKALADAEPGDAGRRRDLAVAYQKLGDAQLAQRDLAAARGCTARASSSSRVCGTPIPATPAGDGIWRSPTKNSATFSLPGAIWRRRRDPTATASRSSRLCRRPIRATPDGGAT